jgi:hypothetical protein
VGAEASDRPAENVAIPARRSDEIDAPTWRAWLPACGWSEPHLHEVGPGDDHSLVDDISASALNGLDTVR